MQRTIDDLEVRLQEVHHRVRRQLQLIASLLSMQAHRSDDERLSRALGDAALRILTIASIDDQLRDQPSQASVEMRGALGAIIDLAQQAVTTGPTVTLVHELESFSLAPGLAVTCGLVVNELVSNALQHAFPGLQGGQVRVRAGAHDGRVTIVVQDNGIGLPPSRARTPRSGMGLDLVRMLAEKQLGGEFMTRRSAGTRCVVTFPLPTPPSPTESGARNPERARPRLRGSVGKVALET